MTAAAPFPTGDRRPLGEVLVERGIITTEQLTTALDRQRSTGQQLGEIIVSLGFAPGPIVAQALATQQGGLIKTEYGFATGWSTNDAPTVAAPRQVDAAELAARDAKIAELRAWVEKAQAAIASRDEAIARLSADLTAQRATAEATSADDAAQREALEALQSEVRDRREEAAAIRAELEADIREQAAEISRLRSELADLNEAAEAHGPELADAREAQTTAERELAGARRTNAELERRLENARSRAETLARRITEQDKELAAVRAPLAAEPSRWASATTHYVLRRGADGYEFAAHDGPPPAVGDTVDGLRVARVAPAGPGFDVPCAYLAD